MDIRTIFFCCAILLAQGISYGQDLRKTKAISIEFGGNLQTSLEQRFVSQAKKHPGFNFTLGYEFGKENRHNQLELNFSKSTLDFSKIADFLHLKPEFRYTHMRAINGKSIHLGGFYDIGALLTFPRNSWTGNNTISYSIWSSLGVAAKWKKSITIKEKSLIIRASGSLPIVGYVVRPAYGLPYTENFLEEGTFDFKQTRLAKAIITGGKIRSLNSFTNYKADIGLALPFGKKGHEVGIQYAWEFFWVGDKKSTSLAQHQLSIGLKMNL